jgi:DHA1 family bicyclomycin/chloramphenicol resistance-like MFS transporter
MPGVPLAVAASALASGGNATYVATSPFIIQDLLGASTATYTTMLITNSAVMVATALLLIPVAHRFRTEMILRWSLTVGGVSMLVLTVASISGNATLTIVWGTLFVNSAVMGVILPTSLIVVQRLGAPFQGTAAALQGFLNYATGALLSPLPSLAGSAAITALGGLMATLFIVATGLIWRLIHRSCPLSSTDD